MSQSQQQIQIGLYTYQVKEVPGLSSTDNDGRLVHYYGRITSSDELIEITEGMSPTRRWVTLWHEILHGIEEQGGAGELSEEMINVLSHGITAVLRDNPWLGEAPK